MLEARVGIELTHKGFAVFVIISKQLVIPRVPTQQNGGYGNCDFAIDLGTASTTSNGLYPSATVWIGSNFNANSTSGKNTYSFPAVAIAGQLNGKYAIFVLGVDSTQPWAIYLLQSN